MVTYPALPDNDADPDQSKQITHLQLQLWGLKAEMQKAEQQIRELLADKEELKVGREAVYIAPPDTQA